MEPLRGLERSSIPAPMTDRPPTKKAVKNLKCNERISAPKEAPSPALKIAKTTLRRASQQRSCPSMAMPRNPVGGEP